MSDLIKEYSLLKEYNYKMTDCTILQHEGNFICGDDISVYLLIQDNIIKKYSFDGNCSLVTKAAANFLGEMLSGKSINEILKRDFNTLYEKGFEVSPRRKRAAVIALLATRNAIHSFMKTSKRDEFDDLIFDY